MSVGSKRFLTTKVDRSVTGLIAQQQCVGALQLPLSDYAVAAQSHFSVRGSATAIGERPTITALSPQAMARMSVGEMMTNLCGARLTARGDIKCEANWMWAAKLPGDCASLYDAAVAMRDIMLELEIAVDGGKDSLSMAARCPTADGSVETVRAPGTLVISGYCTMDDVQIKLTPDLKAPGNSVLILIDVANGKRRLGGSALAQVFSQVGQVAPDVDDGALLANAFDAVQHLITHEGVLSCHDVSDGGLITALLEMGFAGNCGLDVTVDSGRLNCDTTAALFAEELGIVIEVSSCFKAEICEQLSQRGLAHEVIAQSRADHRLAVTDNGRKVLVGDIRDYRDVWESTSFALERQQAKTECVDMEQESLWGRRGAQYVVPYTPQPTAASVLRRKDKPKVAIVREEGSNGDREMSAAFHLSGAVAIQGRCVCGRLFIRGRAGLGKGLGSGDSLQRQADGAAGARAVLARGGGGGGAAALHPQRVGAVRVALRDGEGGGGQPGADAARHGRGAAGRVGGARRGPRALPVGARAGRRAAAPAGGAALRGRAGRAHHALPGQPQRLGGGGGGAVLARRAAPGDDAAPGAHGAAVAVGARAARGGAAAGVAVAAHVPERVRVGAAPRGAAVTRRRCDAPLVVRRARVTAPPLRRHCAVQV
ncbi:phosphoribosylformylglycinamidine synthase [Gracilaria domingensis]|nr:phosphoribosylformylglycinamidine synthase [Gracilaria domingensis]